MSNKKPTKVTLSLEEGQCLVSLARATIARRLGHHTPEDMVRTMENQLQGSVFDCRCGTFVTLKKKGHLRGCIGSLTSDVALKDAVPLNASHAAFHDPRFPALNADELDQVTLEVSVLTPPAQLAYSNADDLIERLRPGTDGVILRQGHASATFLPQVWKQLPRRQDFLSHLCLKAGLEAQAWRDGELKVETYQVQYFKEDA